MKINYKWMALLVLLSAFILPGGSCEKTKEVVTYVNTSLELPNTNWEKAFTGYGGLNGEVRAILISGTDIYVGGAFTSTTDDNRVVGLAKWNGSGWENMGGVDNVSVYALAKDSQGNIYVGGDFRTIGTISTRGIGRYSPTTKEWQTLGTGVEGNVYAIAIDSSDNVYVGGTFTALDPAGSNISADRLGKWDGFFWSALNNKGVNNTVFALEIDKTKKILYVGGQFTRTTTPVKTLNYIGAYDLSLGQWSALVDGGGSTGVGGEVDVIRLESNGDILAGGWFWNAGGDPSADHIARWNSGSSKNNWTALGTGASGVVSVFVKNIVISGSNIYATGSFTAMGGVANTGRIAVWNGAAWSALTGNGLNNNGVGMAVDKANGDLYVGGKFTQTADGSVLMNRIGKYAGSAWTPLGSTSSKAPGTTVYAVSGNGTDVYVGGTFQNAAGNASADYTAKYTSAGTWEVLGTNSLGGTVNALAMAGSDLYAGGNFINVGTDTNFDYIAKLTNVSGGWTILRSGQNDLNGPVYAFAYDSTNNKLYVGGAFTTAGGVTGADRIAVWTPGSPGSWTSLGKGFAGSEVRALALDSSGNLYAGGTFTMTGNNVSAHYIAKWNGSSWGPVSGGTSYFVYSLALDSSGNLYAGGDFTTAGGISAERIAKYSPTSDSWSALWTGLNGTVNALAFDKNKGMLYIGGAFDQRGSLSPKIVGWDGINFIKMGDGASNSVNSIYLTTPRVYVGGSFDWTGDKVAKGLGSWAIPTTP